MKETLGVDRSRLVLCVLGQSASKTPSARSCVLEARLDHLGNLLRLYPLTEVGEHAYLQL